MVLTLSKLVTDGRVSPCCEHDLKLVASCPSLSKPAISRCRRWMSLHRRAGPHCFSCGDCGVSTPGLCERAQVRNACSINVHELHSDLLLYFVDEVYKFEAGSLAGAKQLAQNAENVHEQQPTKAPRLKQQRSHDGGTIALEQQASC